MSPLLVSALEASADQLAAESLDALSVQAFGLGGPAMAARGVELIERVEHLSTMGLTDVARRLLSYQRTMMRLFLAARQRGARSALLVDSPDFHIPLAARLKRHDPTIRTVLLAAPQAWAWRARRADTLAEVFDVLLVLFPFEVEFFSRPGLDVRFVGHPLARSTAVVRDDADAVVFLPGSRPAEVVRHLPAMIAAAEQLKEISGAHRAVVSVAPTIDSAQVRAIMGSSHADVGGPAAEVLPRARLCVTVSGTAALQAGLAGVPTVVVYRTDRLSWHLARRLVRVEHIAMPNILCGKEVFPELLQDAVTGDHIVAAGRRVLASWPSVRCRLESLRPMLEASAPCGELVAEAMRR